MKLGKKWGIIICLHVLIIVVAIVSYVMDISDLKTFSYDSYAMDALVSEEYPSCVGSHIAEGHSDGLYDFVPEGEMLLPKGYYRYEVEYTSEGAEGSFCWPHSYEEYFEAIEQNVAYFQEGTHNYSGEFWTEVDLLVALRLYYDGVGKVTVHNFYIEETPIAANINLFFTIFALLIFDVLYGVYQYNQKNKITLSTKYSFFALLAIVIISSIPALMDYVIKGHDLYFHLTRIEGLKEGLISGQFPVRINPAFYNGYGYANSIFYGELFLYIPALLRLVGFRLTSCYNVYIVLINILTACGSYYCFKKMFRSEVIGIGITALYTLSSYRIMDIYLRSAVGEYTAMAFLPFVVYGMYVIYTEDTECSSYKRCFWPLVIGLSGIIQSHVLTGEMVGGIILLTCVMLIKRTLEKKRFVALVKTVIVTLGVNAWFLVPFIDFSITQDVRALRAPSDALIQKTGTFVGQLMGLFMEYNWLNQDAGAGISSEMPLVLGLSLILGMVLFLATFVADESKDVWKRYGGILFILALITIWMSTVYFPWDKISTMHPSFTTLVASIQFVWRFLALATVLAVTVSGVGLVLLEKQQGKIITIIAVGGLALLTIVSSTEFMSECLKEQGPIVLNNASSLDTTVTATGGEYVLCAARHDDVENIFEPRSYNGVEVTSYEKQGTNISFYAQGGEEEGFVLLPILNYSGYRVRSEDGIISNDNLVMGEGAVVQINVPAGYEGQIEVSYAGRWYWHIGNLISLFTICGYLVVYMRDRMRLAEETRIREM